MKSLKESLTPEEKPCLLCLEHGVPYVSLNSKPLGMHGEDSSKWWVSFFLFCDCNSTCFTDTGIIDKVGIRRSNLGDHCQVTFNLKFGGVACWNPIKKVIFYGLLLDLYV